MRHAYRITSTLAAAIIALTAGAHAQDYREDGWAKLPDGRKWGQTSAIDIDRDGNIWVFERCGANTCAGSNVAPVVKLSTNGKVLLTLGKAGVAGDGPDTFNRPSDVITAPNGDIFVADGHGGDSNARIVKFSKDGKFIKTWGKK